VLASFLKEEVVKDIMMKMKFGGWVLTGLGAYLIAGKVVKMVGKAVEDISTASEWKAYYRAFGKTGRSDMSVPEKKVVYVEKDAEGGNSSPSTEHLKDVIADSIQKATDALLEKRKGVNDPLEGQREAFKEDVCEEEPKSGPEEGEKEAKWYPFSKPIASQVTDETIEVKDEET
jgi:hypothetical protein